MKLFSFCPFVFASLGGYNITNVLPSAPDIAQFKQGVKSVAGKLSVLANGVMTSIQVSKNCGILHFSESCLVGIWCHRACCELFLGRKEWAQF